MQKNLKREKALQLMSCSMILFYGASFLLAAAAPRYVQRSFIINRRGPQGQFNPLRQMSASSPLRFITLSKNLVLPLVEALCKKGEPAAPTNKKSCHCSKNYYWGFGALTGTSLFLMLLSMNPKKHLHVKGVQSEEILESTAAPSREDLSDQNGESRHILDESKEARPERSHASVAKSSDEILDSGLKQLSLALLKNGSSNHPASFATPSWGRKRGIFDILERQPLISDHPVESNPFQAQGGVSPSSIEWLYRKFEKVLFG